MLRFSFIKIQLLLVRKISKTKILRVLKERDGQQYFQKNVKKAEAVILILTRKYPERKRKAYMG